MRRYKRFFADVRTRTGRTITVHCPNPGSMLGCAVPGAAVRCSSSDDPRRRLRHTLEMIRIDGTWVGLHTLRANALAGLALESGRLRLARGYTEVRREVGVEGGARLDFRLSGHRSQPPLWVEVKSVTLAEGRTARFPDSVSERARRHAEVLRRLRKGGERAAILFVVQRGDCTRFEPADAIDPAYGAALREAVRAGVEVAALRTRVDPRALRLDRILPVRLP